MEPDVADLLTELPPLPDVWADMGTEPRRRALGQLYQRLVILGAIYWHQHRPGDWGEEGEKQKGSYQHVALHVTNHLTMM